jgi:hypothetical protein
VLLLAAGAFSLAHIAGAQGTGGITIPQSPSGGKGGADKEADTVLKGLDKVVNAGDEKPLFNLYVDKKEAKAVAELPHGFEKKKYFIALTVSSGEYFAGLQEGDMYVTFRKYGKRLALIEPDLDTRSTGDAESKSSVQRLFTGRVVADVPILADTPRGTVIDLVELFLAQAPAFFPSLGPRMPGLPARLDPRTLQLREVKKAKAFPQNVELAFEIPSRGGKLKTLHFSISELPENTGYKPRLADDRVGYFTTAYDDLGKFKKNETRTRYINRWHLEKADASLKMSPPKQPIVFYIEHTTPIRYRRFVREGVEYWNKAFEKVGIDKAIVVYYQDALTKDHMEKDPEDVRYNFVRWLSNNAGTAIGPSRVHPLTGQILDADIILTDGWIRHFERQFGELLPKLAMEGFGPEALTWLERNPQWDPRYLLMPSHERNRFLEDVARRGAQPLGGHPAGQATDRLMGANEFDGLQGRVSQVNGLCLAAQGKSFDMALLRLSRDLLVEAETRDGVKKEDGDAKDDELDGVPARFIGPLLADLVAHEVGHTLGLRHNFKASALYSMAEVNSKKVKGQKPFASSVMDYLPINIDMKDGEVQGDFAMIGVGPYDMWAIEYGYTFEKDLKPILAKCTLPEHQYGTDQDTIGPDPFAHRYDFSANPLDYARNQMKLAEFHRKRLVTKFVADGESWSRSRHGYDLTLALQMRALNMMAHWLGGALVHRDHKGDKGNRAPIEPVAAATQRDALRWMVDSAFKDEAYSLTPEALRRMRSDLLDSDESFFGFQEATYPVHDRIMGMQSSVLTMLLNPTRLRRIYDNEALIEADKDAVTLPEYMETVTGAIFTELGSVAKTQHTARKPMISSLRRNLQRELVDRLIDLAQPGGDRTAAAKPISNLALLHLRQLKERVEKCLAADVGKEGGKLDSYTRAHLQDAQVRITKALEAPYIFNARDLRPQIPRFFFQTPPGDAACSDPACSCRTRGWDTRRP